MAYYTFDPNGNLAANLITNEQHSVNTINGVDHQYMVPRDAPFFDASMVVVDVNSGVILTKGVDYEITYKFDAGVSEVGTGLSGAIYLIDKNRTGLFALRYQTLGGDFVTATTRAIGDGLDTLAALQTTTWDQIAPSTLPTTWPVTPHTQSVNDIEAVDRLSAALENVANLLTQKPPYIHVEDIIDLDTVYFQPMIQATNEVADAIRTVMDKTLHYENYRIPLNPDKSLPGTAGDINKWVSTGLIVPVNADGTYLLSHHCKPLFGAGDNPKYRLRYTISTNGGVTWNPVEKSYLNNIPQPLVSGWFLRLEIYFQETHNGALISSDASGTEVGTSLTICRLGI